MNQHTGNVIAVGAGRMGRGIAQMFAYAGRKVVLLDVKERETEDLQQLKESAAKEISGNLRFMCEMSLLQDSQIERVMANITIAGRQEAAKALAQAEFVLEGVPETIAAKTAALSLISDHAPVEAIVTSTTSTMLVTQLQDLMVNPSRFLNTHFLNPAYLIPLVEVSAGPDTDENVVVRTMALFESIGKVPVRCAPTAGYIVPRLQALIMSEACRMVEQGVASAEDIDKAIMSGFGPRYATMGVLEFVDWGGVDILYYAGHYLAKELDSPAFKPPDTVSRMMDEGHRGLREGKGYYDYHERDVEAFQKDKLTRFVKLLSSLGHLPKTDI